MKTCKFIFTGCLVVVAAFSGRHLPAAVENSGQVQTGNDNKNGTGWTISSTKPLEYPKYPYEWQGIQVKAGDLIYQQWGSPSEEPSTASQEFLDAQDFSCQAADDFVVPPGQFWVIEEVRVAGFFNEEGMNPLPMHILLYHHNPALGKPEDTPFLQAFSGSLYDGIRTFSAVFDPLEIPSGHYWISVQASMPSSFGQWFWDKQSVPQIYQESVWRNPLNGFGDNCQDWTWYSDVPGFEEYLDYNFAFSLYGEIMTDITEVSCPPDFIVCEDGPGMPLEGATPPGGVYDGPGVSGGVFFPSISGPGNFLLTYTTPDELATCAFQAIVTPIPNISAGPDWETQANNPITLEQSRGSDYASLLWTSEGDGIFSNNTLLHPVYTPGPGDMAAGHVELCLNADAIPPCEGSVFDCMTLWISMGDFPQITCPPDVTVLTDPGTCLASDVNLGEPSIVDPYGLAALINDAPDGFAPGYHVVEWTAENIHGMTASCLQGVWVYDDELPNIPSMSDIVLENDHRMCGAVAVWQPPVITDNCGWTVLNTSHFPSGFFPVGSTEVTLIATDQHNNESVSRFTVTVIDTEPPHRPAHLPDPPDITLVNEPGQCGAHAHWDPPEFNDNCDESPHVSGSHAPGDFFPAGTTRVRYTATDVHGNASTSGFEVTVIDTESPHRPAHLPDPPDITLGNEPGQCGAHAHWDPPEYEDNCGESPHVSGSHAPGDFFPAGTTRVRYTATDVHGNASTSGFEVTVIDTESPHRPAHLPDPPDITLDNEPGQCGAHAHWDPPEYEDNCDDPPHVSGSHAPGDFFPAGTTRVRYTATDVHGNASTAGFEVTVIDTEPPHRPAHLPDPPDITLDNEPGQCGAHAHWDPPEYEDNCDDPPHVSGSHAPGDFLPAGTTKVRYTATDSHGNSAYAGFTVSVIDVEPPTVEKPPDMRIPNEPGHCGTWADWPSPLAMDNCDVQSLTSNYEPGDYFSVGHHQIAYVVTDSYGNTSATTFLLEVYDEFPPELSCPEPIKIYVSDPPETTAIDLAGASPPGGHYAGPGIAGTQFYPHIAGVGTHSITYTYVNPTSTCQYVCTFGIEVAVATAIPDIREPFLIYPNPNKGNFTIDGPTEIPTSIMIIDIIGKEVKSLTTPLPAEIKLTGQPPGIYCIRIVTPSHVHVEKIIIQ